MMMWESVRTIPRRTQTQFISCKSRQFASTSLARRHTSPASLASYFSKCGRYSPTTRLCQGKGGGIYCPYSAINGWDDWIFTEVDEQNIPVSPTYDEVVAVPKFRNVRFQSANHGDLLVPEAERVSDLDRLQYASNHQKDTAFVCDTIFRCIALGHNCDYMTFYRTDVIIGRKVLKVDLAMICVQSVKEVDTPLTQWCYIAIYICPRATSRRSTTISARKVPMEGK